LARSNSLAESDLRANREAPTEANDEPQKKICWMKKNMLGNGVAIAPIVMHRANHPNQLLIRDRFSEPKFRF
jgi:hypothetical protein